VSEGNTEQAISLYLEGGGVNLGGEFQQSHNDIEHFEEPIEFSQEQQQQQSNYNSSSHLDDVRAPIAAKFDTLMGDVGNDYSSNYSSIGTTSSIHQRYGAGRGRRSHWNNLNDTSSNSSAPPVINPFRDEAQEQAILAGMEVPQDKVNKLAELFR